MEGAQEKLEVSERRACRTVGQPRSTQRYAPMRPEEEEVLVARMLELVRRHPRYGYRRIWALLRQEGWQVNRKRVYRLWRREGLRVPRKGRKRRRLGSGENGCARHRPEHKDHVWARDFIHDRTTSGGPLKWLTVVDEACFAGVVSATKAGFTRDWLVLEAARTITAEDVVERMIRLLRERGVPDYIRSDNGPEFIAKPLREWLERASVGTLYVEPGAPWENG